LIQIKRARVVLPQPRNISYLQMAMQPNITSAKVCTPGYALGEEAWGVIQKNYYYSPEQQHLLCNGIAHMANKIEAYCEKNKDMKPEMIFQYGFKKGLSGIEEEDRLKALAGLVTVVDDEYLQEDTDWDVEAVEDEDQLFETEGEEK